MSSLSTADIAVLPIPSAPGATVVNPASQTTIVASSNTQVILCAWVDSGGYMVEPKQGGAVYKNGERTARGVVENLYGKYNPSAPHLNVAVIEQWTQVGSNVNSPGSAPVEYSLQVKDSISTTESLELSLQFGFNTGSFSAEFAAKFSRSITVSNETTNTHSYTYPSSADEYIQTIIWQKSATLIVVDDNGNPFTWADSELKAVIKPDYNSGAEYQSYIKPPSQVQIPSTIFVQNTRFDRNGILLQNG